jgi:hypothetical protein
MSKAQEKRFDVNSVEAQDVIDALRLAYMAQEDATKLAALTEAMLDFAPETDSNRGIQLLLDLIVEGSLRRVELVRHPAPKDDA